MVKISEDKMLKKVVAETKKLFAEFLTQMGLDSDIKVAVSKSAKEESAQTVAGAADSEKSTDAVESEETDSGASVYPKEDVHYVNVKLEGEHLNELVGYHGRNLDAAQTILGLILSHRLDSKNYRLVLEINDYRERREKYLLGYAERAALQVRDSGQELELTPMKPAERRVIHLALKKEQGVVSKSIGEGEERRIVVSKV